MSTADYRFSDSMYGAYVYCKLCSDHHGHLIVARVHGEDLHAVVSAALAHDAKVHKEEK